MTAELNNLLRVISQCGNIREVKITQLNNSLVATVEFMDRVRGQWLRCHSHQLIHQ